VGGGGVGAAVVVEVSVVNVRASSGKPAGSVEFSAEAAAAPEASSSEEVSVLSAAELRAVSSGRAGRMVVASPTSAASVGGGPVGVSAGGGAGVDSMRTMGGAENAPAKQSTKTACKQKIKALYTLKILSIRKF
jgi:hypothetical protein